MHNVSVLDVGGRTEVSLHLKLPGRAHAGAGARGRQAGRGGDRSGRARGRRTCRRTSSRSPSSGRATDGRGHRRARRRAAHRPRRHRPASRASSASCARTTASIAYLTLGLDAASPLAEAHARASEIEERIRRARPDIADVIVHTEPYDPTGNIRRRLARDHARSRPQSGPGRKARALPASLSHVPRPRHPHVTGGIIEALHVHAARPAARAGLAGDHRGRHRRAARGADVAGVLHRRRKRAAARRVPAGRGRLPPAGPAPAVGARLLRVRAARQDGASAAWPGGPA